MTARGEVTVFLAHYTCLIPCAYNPMSGYGPLSVDSTFILGGYVEASSLQYQVDSSEQFFQVAVASFVTWRHLPADISSSILQKCLAACSIKYVSPMLWDVGV